MKLLGSTFRVKFISPKPLLTLPIQLIVNDMTQATFDDIIAEVKKVNQRLESIERTLSALMTMLMPEEELSEEEWREIEEIEAEMKGGLTVPLEELEKVLR